MLTCYGHRYTEPEASSPSENERADVESSSETLEHVAFLSTIPVSKHSTSNPASYQRSSIIPALPTLSELKITSQFKRLLENDDKVSGFHFDLLVNAIDKSGKRKRSPTFTFISTFDKDWNTYQILEKPLAVPEHTGTP